MINMYSNMCVLDENIKMFNIRLSSEDRKKMKNIFSTIAPQVKANRKNKIVLIKDKDMIQAEALIYKCDKKIKLHAVGFDLFNTFKEITQKIGILPEFIHSSNSNFFRTL